MHAHKIIVIIDLLFLWSWYYVFSLCFLDGWKCSCQPNTTQLW